MALEKSIDQVISTIDNVCDILITRILLHDIDGASSAMDRETAIRKVRRDGPKNERVKTKTCRLTITGLTMIPIGVTGTVIKKHKTGVLVDFGTQDDTSLLACYHEDQLEVCKANDNPSERRQGQLDRRGTHLG